jgi:hypothetical protein
MSAARMLAIEFPIEHPKMSSRYSIVLSTANLTASMLLSIFASISSISYGFKWTRQR